MILFRYLSREIFVSMFAVSVTLLLIVMSGRFVKYLAQAASGDLAPEVLLSIMAYRLPSFLELVLPLGLFIGILLAYGRLYVESEMAVMSSCGLSTSRLMVFTLAPSFAVALLVGYLSLFVSPAGIAKVQEIFQQSKHASGLETLVAGRFRVSEDSGTVVYIGKLSADRQQMYDIFSAEQRLLSDGSTELGIVLAEQGEVVVQDDIREQYLVLDNGFRYTGQPGAQSFQVTQFQRFGQQIKEKKRPEIIHKKADARSTRELLNSSRLEDKATLQWRLSLIILVPIIALIAQAMSHTNHRRGRYVKMLPAFLLYIVYLVVLNTARDAVETGRLSAAYGIWSVHLIFLALAMLLLYGNQWWRYLSGEKA